MKKYYYPANLKKKPVILVWEYKVFFIIAIMLIVSVIIWANTSFFLPLVCTAVYAFCNMRLTDRTVWNYLVWATRYFISQQQLFFWR